MPDTTQEQVDRARERVDRLNAQIAEEKAKAAAFAVENVNDLRVVQLTAEGDRLQAELDALRAANSKAPEAVEQLTQQVATTTVFGGPTTGGDATGEAADAVLDDDTEE